MNTLKRLKAFSLLLAGLLLVSKTNAQVTVNSAVTATQLVQNIVGGNSGVNFSNVTSNCVATQWGSFNVVSSNLGLDSGIILTSGTAATGAAVVGANTMPVGTQTFVSTCQNTPGDPQLNTLLTNGILTHDACILEFDFVPDGDSLSFKYVFGSQEYTNYSCSTFDDVFGFFLSGPGIVGAPNIALIPGTNIFVGVNSTTGVNTTGAACTSLGPGSPFSMYYVNNYLTAGCTINYPGFTLPFRAQHLVTPCSTYHIKLAIADAGDCVFDSGVFIASNSFHTTSSHVSYSSALGPNYNYIIRGCVGGSASVTITHPVSPNPQTVLLGYGGTCIRGVDFFSVPDSVIFAPGDSTYTFTINVVGTGTTTAVTYIAVQILNPCTHLPVDSIVIPVYPVLPINLLSVDTSICGGAGVRLQVSGDPNFAYHWTCNPANGGIVNPNDTFTTGYADTTTVYTVTAVFHGCPSDTFHFTATVEPFPIVTVIPKDTMLCIKDSMQIYSYVGPSYFSNYTYTWSPGSFLSNPNINNPLFFCSTSGNYQYILAVNTPLGCTSYDTIYIRPRPPLVLNVIPDQTIHYGDSVRIWAKNAVYYTWKPTNTLDNPTWGYPVASPLEPTTYSVLGINEFGCADSAHVHVDIDYSTTQFVPSAFSPNGDGKNDRFKIIHMKFHKLLEFRVFNRWGQEVFSTLDPEGGWDGTFNGQLADVGNYTYLIRIVLPNGTEKDYTGDVALIR
jgi:gliding motility-associated-like protein